MIWCTRATFAGVVAMFSLRSLFGSPDVISLYRRRAHIIVWTADYEMTEPDWDLYWSPSLDCTFVRLGTGGESDYWLPVSSLPGYDHWLTGRIEDYRIYEGWPRSGMPRPKSCKVWRWPDAVCDGGHLYWYDVKVPKYDPDAHS